MSTVFFKPVFFRANSSGNPFVYPAYFYLYQAQFVKRTISCFAFSLFWSYVLREVLTESVLPMLCFSSKNCVISPTRYSVLCPNVQWSSCGFGKLLCQQRTAILPKASFFSPISDWFHLLRGTRTQLLTAKFQHYDDMFDCKIGILESLTRSQIMGSLTQSVCNYLQP